jgi:hypothetical protein
MREFGTQVTTGVMRYPEALDATIGECNTLPLSSMWLNAGVYGIPLALFEPHASIVDIGRTVTACLTVALLVAMYWISRKLGVRKEFASLGILTLVCTRTFFLASHSARYDIWVGLGILLAWYAAVRFVRRNDYGSSSWLVFGLTLPLLLVWNIHVLRIAGILWVYAFLVAGGWRSGKASIWTIAGALSGVAVLAIAYLIFSGNIILADGAAAGSQFNQVTKNIPLLHPLSPQLQGANLVIRFNQWASEAPFLLVLFAMGLFGWVYSLFRKNHAHDNRVATAALLLFFAWVVTMRPLPYYDLHILPVLAVIAILTISRFRSRPSFVQSLIVAVVAVAMAVFSFKDISVAKSNGELATQTTSRISESVKSDIRKRVNGRSTVMMEVPFITPFIRDTSFQFISPYFLIFPKDSITPPEFLRKHQVQFVGAEGTRLTLPSGFALTGHGYEADSAGVLIGRYVGYFNDNYRSYFSAFQPPPDTFSLYRIKAQ